MVLAQAKRLMIWGHFKEREREGTFQRRKTEGKRTGEERKRGKRREVGGRRREEEEGRGLGMNGIEGILS